MRLAWAVLVVAGCAGAPSSPPAPSPAEADKAEEHGPVDAAAPTAATMEGPERSRPPSRATYEQAMSKPEPVAIEDDRIQLTDAQLKEPVSGVLRGCPVPPNAKVVIRVAVENGRAAGVTVDVRFEHPPPPGRRTAPSLSPAALRYEAKVRKKIGVCVDRAVREAVWPPSRRRDSLQIEF